MVRSDMASAVLVGLALTLGWAGVSHAAPDAKKGKALSLQCAACHGNNGISVDNNIPNLAAQHYVYLVAQMDEYKNKTRVNGIMNEMLGPLSQEQIEHIAAYYSSIPLTAKPSQPGK